MYLFFARFIWLPEFMQQCAGAIGKSYTASLWKFDVMVSLGGVIHCEMQDTLAGGIGVCGIVRNPQAKRIPAKQFFSHQLLSTHTLTSLCPGGCKICST